MEMRFNSIAESGAAFGASSLEHLAAVGGGHSLAEAMLLLTLELLGLICSEHRVFNSFAVNTGYISLFAASNEPPEKYKRNLGRYPIL